MNLSLRSLARRCRILAVAALGAIALAVAGAAPDAASAHQSGCHAAHSCPSDTGSYVCGDTGNFNYCGGGSTTTTPTSTSGTPSTTTPVQTVSLPPRPPSPPSPSDPAGDKDCANFASQAEAQAYFGLTGGPVSDPDRLDADNDGIACEAGETAPTKASGCDVRTGTTADPVDTPSSPYDVIRADVLFERCIGRLTLTTTFNAPLPPAPLPAFDSIVWWLGGLPCDLPSLATVYSNVSFMNGANFNVEPTSDYTKIYPALSADRRALTLSFSSPVLTANDLRCARLATSASAAGATTGYDSVETFWFDGFGPDARKTTGTVGQSTTKAKIPSLSATDARRYARSALKRTFRSSYRSTARVSCARLSRIRRQCVARWTRPGRARYSGVVTIWHQMDGNAAEWHYSVNVGRRDLRCRGAGTACLKRIVVD